MRKDAQKMIKQPLHLIEIILTKHQEAILEVCAELKAENDRLKRQRDKAISLVNFLNGAYGDDHAHKKTEKHMAELWAMT